MPYKGAGGWGQPGCGDKESERQVLLQTHREEMVGDCGEEDGAHGEGKVE